MKKIWTPFLFACIASVGIYSCKKEAKQTDTAATATVSTETMAKIHQLGFSTTGVQRVEDGYLVEGDIVLSDDLLNSTPDYKLLRIGGEEQYRTTNLVSRLPRTITIKVSNLGTAYVQGADLAISRYNTLGSQIQFKRVSSGTTDITIRGFNQPPSGGYITLGSSGFPSNGNPYSTIKMNTNQYAYGSNPDVNYVGSVIQHEIGHCIGFRHTDYMDRSYSCGGAYSNEGASNVGAILIPGTPSGPDPNSWMLACSNGGDRTFNNNDVTALHYLYH
jgi:hypothetical protein